MVGEIDDRVLIGRGGVVDSQFVLVGQGVDHLGSQVSRKALFTIRAEVCQFHRLPMAAGNIFGRPQTFVESLQSAVQCVVAVVLRDVVSNAIQNEFSVCDAIGVATYDGAEECFVGQVAVQLVVAQDHIVELAASVGYFEGDDDAAKVGDGGFHPVVVGQSVEIDRLPVFGFPERLFLHGLLRFGASQDASQQHASQDQCSYDCARFHNCLPEYSRSDWAAIATNAFIEVRYRLLAPPKWHRELHHELEWLCSQNRQCQGLYAPTSHESHISGRRTPNLSTNSAAFGWPLPG